MTRSAGVCSRSTTFHVGFIEESEQRVGEINQRLKDGGFDVDPPGRLHGSWTSIPRA
jgi:lactoylglutathione lyase